MLPDSCDPIACTLEVLCCKPYVASDAGYAALTIPEATLQPDLA